MKILLIASIFYLTACAPLDHYHYVPNGGVTSAAVVPGDGCCAAGVGPTYAPPAYPPQAYAPPPPPPPPAPVYYYREWQPAYQYPCRGWC